MQSRGRRAHTPLKLGVLGELLRPPRERGGLVVERDQGVWLEAMHPAQNTRGRRSLLRQLEVVRPGRLESCVREHAKRLARATCILAVRRILLWTVPECEHLSKRLAHIRWWKSLESKGVELERASCGFREQYLVQHLHTVGCTQKLVVIDVGDVGAAV